MKNAARHVAKTIAVLLVLYFAAMLAVSAVGDLVTVAKLTLRDGDKRKRHELVVFEDKELARQIFKDSKQTVENYAPFVGWRRQALRSETVNIAADGRRLHKVGGDNVPGSERLGFFGGSGIWGSGAEDDGTVPAIFDQLTDNYDIENYGEGGWTSRQSLAQLVNLMSAGRTLDVAVFYNGPNDATLGCDTRFADDLIVHKRTPLYRHLILADQSRSYLYRNFVVPTLDTYQRVTGLRNAEREYVCDRDPAQAAKIAATLFNNWKIARTLMTSGGGRFYAFLRPVPGVGSPMLDHLSLDPRLIAQYEPVYDAIKKLIREEGAGWAFDLSDSFDGPPPVYMDAGHVTRVGNAIIARRMHEFLQRH